MKVQVMDITGTAMQDAEIVINSVSKTEDRYNIRNNIGDINLLRINKSKKKCLIYLNLFIKRIIDIIGGIVGSIILIPLTVIVAIINFIEKDYGPVFYSHTRIGKDGKYFKMYKFRTMVVDADKKLEEYLASNEEARAEYKKYKKLKNDPRVTKIGNFLRKTSLDEMPQLVLLLTGKMSLVGPRPYLPREMEDMGEYYDIIIKSKPGLTGLWYVLLYAENRLVKEAI